MSLMRLYGRMKVLKGVLADVTFLVPVFKFWKYQKTGGHISCRKEHQDFRFIKKTLQRMSASWIWLFAYPVAGSHLQVATCQFFGHQHSRTPCGQWQGVKTRSPLSFNTSTFNFCCTSCFELRDISNLGESKVSVTRNTSIDWFPHCISSRPTCFWKMQWNFWTKSSTCFNDFLDNFDQMIVSPSVIPTNELLNDWRVRALVC